MRRGRQQQAERTAHNARFPKTCTDPALVPAARYGAFVEWTQRNAALCADIDTHYRVLSSRCLRYNMLVHDWMLMLIHQDGRCGICRRPYPPFKLHIDHDHQHGHVRGLLCTSCNTGLGLLGIDGEDSDRRITNVVAYLEHGHKRRRSSRTRSLRGV
jgi:hypothetical protein